MVFEQAQKVPVKEEKNFKTWYKKFSSQPHQPFFSSGILFFILFLSLFTASYSNILNLDSSVLTYHAYTMVFVVFIQFFLGFLFVVFPRFLVQAEITPDVYMKQFAFYFLPSLFILISLVFYSKALILFQIVLLGAQIFSFKLLYSIHKKSLVQKKEDTKWVLIGFASGLIAHFLYIISAFDFAYSEVLAKFAINSGFYLFLFTIIFAIAQRMVPFFTTSKVPTYKINKTENIMLYIFSLLVLKVVLLSFDNSKLNLLADIPLFILITKELVKWKLPIFKVPAIMWVLYLSLYWIPIGFALSIVESIFAFISPDILFEKSVLHTFALGYFVTILLGFGTRVVLGHSGATPHADKFAVSIFIAAQIIVILRVFASLSLNFSSLYVSLINLSAILLIIGLIIWSSRYVMILLKGK